MLSRLSSFSGPLSPAFKIPGGFTLNGLILRYVISDTDSYSGTTTVTDLKSNSNATLNGGPTFSLNGYLNFDGTNDYLMTNTSLASLFTGSSPNKSEFTSICMWVYPQDNGVLLTEQGFTTLNSGWHDSQIEMVSGSLEFGMWSGVGITGFVSSVSTPFHKWYYLSLVYNGSTLSAYVNGQLAGTTTFDRYAPYNNGSALHYAIAAEDFTSQGDGTYVKMKLGDFHVYNIALSQQQVINNYNITKNNYIHTDNMSIWIDANDPQSFSGGLISDLSGNGYTHSLTGTSSTIYGFRSFDCNPSNNYIRVNGTGPTLPTTGYTYVAWARIKSDSSTYRTLYRNAPNDHAILVEIGTDNLGFWDNDSGVSGFKDSGYDVTPIEEKWVQYSVVGDSSSSIFYINDIQVGSVSFGAGGNKHDYFGGLTGQPFGYVGNMMLYSKKLTQTEIKQNYDALKNVYKNGDFVSDNLVLYYNPASFLSYPGSGTVVSNLVSNSLNGTMSNVTHNQTYFTFNGSTSQINISDSASLEPGSGDWTMEVWIKPTSLSAPGQVVLGKFDPGGNSADISYAIRISNSNVRADFSNGTSAVVTSNYTLSVNNWTHLVYVFNNVSNNNIITYVNGASYSTTTHSFASILNTSANLYLGSYNGGEYPQYFTGQMGIVRLYSSALSPSDVSTNFEANRNIYGI